jgi:two-component system response regulator RegA
MKLARLLVVEDDAAYRERMVVAFRRRGLEVRGAANASEAVSVSTGWTFDGAVVDLRMPQGSGLEVIRELHARCPSARLVVLTGYGSIATALKAVQAGAVDYLTKPADADQILAALEGSLPQPENPKEPPVTTPSLDRVEWEHMQRVLHDCGGNISQAARALGLDRRSLQRKLAKYPPTR